MAKKWTYKKINNAQEQYKSVIFFCIVFAIPLHSITQQHQQKSENIEDSLSSTKQSQSLPTIKDKSNITESQKKGKNKQEEQSTTQDQTTQDFSKRRILYAHNGFEVPVPFFYVQAGIGMTFTSKLARIDPTITSDILPTFGIALGFNQQFNLPNVYAGIKLQINYEVALHSLGENTRFYKNSGLQFTGYIGFYRFLPYVGFVYEIMEGGKTILPSFNLDGRYTSYGPGVVWGLNVVFTKHNAIDLSVRHSQIYEFQPRVILNYELRF
ncbi:hypothetical protein CQA53_05515 [Helicobacter didelphidarum]|uniref:Uncharacterized protein n=1 Tax=Helicobacter didelphidarum TaxID=2040648 RepID=A0A3D8IMU8_9HELI|nr:hypothetical protein [Helicobacter didelphidarum]RDU65901.1 hypothetical protein CQA53_05515 [Helicobacter didelphidarum]